MADVKVELSQAAIGTLLRTPEMEAEMVRRAAAVMDLAVARAPVAREGGHRGRYKASFRLEHGREGAPGTTTLSDRAWAQVVNDAPEALYVEYGNRGREPLHVLLNALIEGARD